ncbi:MAG: glycosyl hydrolase [Flavobacteriaceae bacterium]|nr:glycosyl hydrolase [Flavobacteriaceae bacterium]|tara:strand:- start:22018 stop:22764 length:747 start_codon:yes stop_codon:yes gene_type:complete
MKNIILSLAIILISCKETTKEKQKIELDNKAEKATSNDWVYLFDGETFNGWHQYNKKEMSPAWSIKDGAMTFSPLEKNYGGSHDIITDNSFTNFILSLEWKISKNGNSGIFWSVKEDPKYYAPYQSGPEIQVLDNDGHPDAFIKPKFHQAGALYDLVEPKSDVCNPAENWNHVLLEINHNKNQGSVKLNGTEIVAFPVNGKEWQDLLIGSKFESKEFKDLGIYQTGHIGLQDHGDIVSFRNIKIREIE